jgi:hypothetical protein
MWYCRDIFFCPHNPTSGHLTREQDVIFTLEGKNKQVVCKTFTANDVFFKILKIVFFKKCVGSPVDKILQHLSNLFWCVDHCGASSSPKLQLAASPEPS